MPLTHDSIDKRPQPLAFSPRQNDSATGHRMSFLYRSILLKSASIGFPIGLMELAPEVSRLAAEQGSLQKEPDNCDVTHLQETPVRGVDAAADDAKTTALDLSRELIILGIQRLFIKTAEFFKPDSIHHHEHSRRKGFMEPGETLGYVVQSI